MSLKFKQLGLKIDPSHDSGWAQERVNRQRHQRNLQRLDAAISLVSIGAGFAAGMLVCHFWGGIKLW